MKRPLVIHHFLVAACPILFLTAHNIQEVSVYQAVVPLVLVIAISLVLWVLAHRLTGDSMRGALIVSLFWILFFSYGYVHELSMGAVVRDVPIGRHRYLLSVWILVLIAVSYLVVRTRRDLQMVSRWLNFTGVALVGMSTFNIAFHEITRMVVWRDEERSPLSVTRDADMGTRGSLPDIYYIVLDAYAGSEALREFSNYDNGEFTQFLRSRGFYVASASRSNYETTWSSLASSLNMEYFDFSEATVPFAGLVVDRMMRNNRVVRFLKAQGYRYVHFSSGSPMTDYSPQADTMVWCGKYNEFGTMLFHVSALKALLDTGSLNFVEDDARKRILCTFEKAAELGGVSGPKFVFIHMLLPHPPFLFGRNGEAVEVTDYLLGADVWEQRDRYIDQLVFANAKVKVLVERILHDAEVPPVIILQGDHGPWSSRGDLEYPKDRFLRERTSILNAYHLPGDGDRLPYESISPVNTFRVVFNAYFDAGLELLKDEVYVSTLEEAYKFLRVTDRLN